MHIFFLLEDPKDYRADMEDDHDLVADIDSDTLIRIVKFLKRGKAPGVRSKFLGGEGVVDGEGGSSEKCLTWDGGFGVSLSDLSTNILKQGVGKGKSCS